MEDVVADENTRTITYQDFYKICRFCLAEGELGNIFNIIYDNANMADIYKALFSIEVYINDDLPQNICEKCIYELVRFYNFRNNCVRSESALRAIMQVTEGAGVAVATATGFGIQQIDCDVDIKEEVEWGEEEEDEFGEAALQTEDPMMEAGEEFVPKVEDEEVEEEEEEVLVYEGDGEPICSICLMKFDSMRNLQRHVALRHYEKNSFVCEICDKVFARLSSLQEHERAHHDLMREDTTIVGSVAAAPPPSPHTAGAFSGAKPTAAAPRKRAPPQSRQFECPQCDRRFPTKAGYVMHSKAHQRHLVAEQRPLLKCSYCDEIFDSDLEVKVHLQTHDDEALFSCDVCEEEIFGVENLEMHKLSHRDTEAEEAEIM